MVGIQEIQHDLPTSAAPLQIELQRSKGVLRQHQVRRTIRANDEQPHPCEMGRQVGQELDGREVGPVEVVEQQNNGP